MHLSNFFSSLFFGTGNITLFESLATNEFSLLISDKNAPETDDD